MCGYVVECAGDIDAFCSDLESGLRSVRMDKAELVDANIEDDRRVVDELERARLNISSAFGFHSEDEDDLNLVIVSPDVAEKDRRKSIKNTLRLCTTFKLNWHQDLSTSGGIEFAS